MADINKVFEQTEETRTWEDLLRMIVDKSMLNTHVATLAFVEKDEGFKEKYGVVTCKPFPLQRGQKEYVITAYYLKKVESKDEEKKTKFSKGDIVCVLFMDFDFRDNIIGENPSMTLNTQNHALSFGIIIDTL